MRAIQLIVVAALAVFFASSCETDDVVQPDPHAGHDHGDDGHRDDVVPLPKIRWEVHPSGGGYDLDLVVAGKDNHVARGGEYLRGNGVSRSSRNVPSGTVSAYEVLLPDGEIDLYWIEEGRPGTLLVYRKFYDAHDDSWGSERRVLSVNY